MAHGFKDRFVGRCGGGGPRRAVRPGGGSEARPGWRIVKFGIKRFDLRFERGDFRTQRAGALGQRIGFLFEEGHNHSGSFTAQQNENENAQPRQGDNRQRPRKGQTHPAKLKKTERV